MHLKDFSLWLCRIMDHLDWHQWMFCMRLNKLYGFNYIDKKHTSLHMTIQKINWIQTPICAKEWENKCVCCLTSIESCFTSGSTNIQIVIIRISPCKWAYASIRSKWEKKKEKKDWQSYLYTACWQAVVLCTFTINGKERHRPEGKICENEMQTNKWAMT